MTSMHRQRIGGLCFALGKQSYQRMAALQAVSFQKHSLEFTAVVLKGQTVLPALEKVANVVQFDRSLYLPFEFERYAMELSPYDLTIKTDADLLLPPGWAGLPPWLHELEYATAQPVSVTGVPVRASPYRRKWTSLGLPEVYSAFFAFKKTKGACKFFDRVNYLFENYHSLSVRNVEGQPSTDLIYSMAWHSLHGQDVGPTLPFIHMKSGTSGLELWRDDWKSVLSYQQDSDGIYINGVQIVHPFHYYDKTFIEDSHVHMV